MIRPPQPGDIQSPLQAIRHDVSEPEDLNPTQLREELDYQENYRPQKEESVAGCVVFCFFIVFSFLFGMLCMYLVTL